MNPEKNLREELEARLTALLLGELGVDDAELLRKLIAHDPELAKLHERLKRTIELVRETSVNVAEPTAPQPEPLKLSEERRQKLLAQFKTVRPKEFVPAVRRSSSARVIAVAAVLALAAVLAAALLPALSKAKSKSSRFSALQNSPVPAATWSGDNREREPMNYSAGMAPSDQGKGSREDLWLNAGVQAQKPNNPRINRRAFEISERAPAAAAPPVRTTIVLPSAVDVADASKPSTVADYDRLTSYNSWDRPSDGKEKVVERNAFDLYDPPSRPPTSASLLAQNQEPALAFRLKDDVAAAQPKVPERTLRLETHGAGDALGDKTFSSSDFFAPAGVDKRGEFPGSTRGVTTLSGRTTPSQNDWVGVLERPTEPHSVTNAFVSRYAFITPPTTETLDLNYSGFEVVAPNQVAVAENGLRKTMVQSSQSTLLPMFNFTDGANQQVAANNTDAFYQRSDQDGDGLKPQANPGSIPRVTVSGGGGTVNFNNSAPSEVNKQVAANNTDPFYQRSVNQRLNQSSTSLNSGTVNPSSGGFGGAGGRGGGGSGGFGGGGGGQADTLGALEFKPKPPVQVGQSGAAGESRPSVSQSLRGFYDDTINRNGSVKTYEDRSVQLSSINGTATAPQTDTQQLIAGNNVVIDAESDLGVRRFFRNESRGETAREDSGGPANFGALYRKRVDSNATHFTNSASLGDDANGAFSTGLTRDELPALRGRIGPSSNVYDVKIVGYADVPVTESRQMLQNSFGANVLTSGGKETGGKGLYGIVLPSNAPAAGQPTITVDAASGDLIVSGDEARIDEIRRSVALMERPTRQQLIDTNAIGDLTEASLGRNWNYAGQRQNGDQSDTHGSQVAGTIIANSSIQNARVLLEAGKLNEAEAELGIALQADPKSSTAQYYSRLVEQKRAREGATRGSEKKNVEIADAWSDPAQREKLRVENRPYYEAKQRLAQLTQKGTALESRIASEKTDQNLPRFRMQQRPAATSNGVASLQREWAETEKQIAQAKAEVDRLEKQGNGSQPDAPAPKTTTPPPIPQPEVATAANPFSTFSLNVSDVSFKLAAASLQQGAMPDPGGIRSEEFINAFDYRDPEAAAGAPIAFAWDRAHYPFAHNRDLLRFSVKTAAAGRQAGRPLNLVLLLDNSGSMERADRVRILRAALRVLASQLHANDRFSVITFSRQARLWVDGVSGDRAVEVVDGLDALTPQGGTNLEDAMNVAYTTALRHYLANGINRVVLLTDGAANLGNVDPEALKQKVEAQRKQGIALDCFGIGWEGYNDDLLEALSRNGDGRYGFLNSAEEAATEFAAKLAGALQVAASDVKVQVEFNPKRVTSYRQIGYAKHQLTKEQFRDNTVDAAEIAAQEAGNALYTIEVNPAGEGPLGVVRVRYKIPGTSDYREQEWTVPFSGNAPALEQSAPAMRLAATASAFSEWLASSPFGAEVTPDRLLNCLNGVPDVYGVDGRPKTLEWMIRQAKSISGK